MFEYYHEGLRKVSDAYRGRRGEREYVDFFSGSLFEETVQSLGGVEAVKHDIFVFLTTDGAQPFNSSTYSYWPVVLMIGNPESSKRFKR